MPISNKNNNKKKTKILLNKNKKIFDKLSIKGKKKNDEENKKIKSVLSGLMMWDNKQMIESSEALKWAKVFCDKEKEKFKLQKKYEERSQQYNEKKLSEIIMDEETNKKIFDLKFSVFDKDFDFEKFKKEEEKIEEKIKKEKKNDLNKNIKNNFILNSQKEKSNKEDLNKEKLLEIYNYIISNKSKKEKYKEVIESAYNLLNQATQEYTLSVDLLNQRKKSVQKYYEAYIESMKQIKDSKMRKKNTAKTIPLNISEETELHKEKSNIKLEQFEEKMNRYREYISIADEINKEIKSYEDQYISVKDDLNSFIDKAQSKIGILTDEISKFKYLFNELKNTQVEYYLEKLKIGTDTRHEGLSWIVKELIELKAKIDPNLFPKFLDEEQINYIINIAKLGFENNQLKIILKLLRDKKQELLNIKERNKNNKDINGDNKNNILAHDINFDIDFNDCVQELIEEKGILDKRLTDLQENYCRKIGISPIIRFRIENKKINAITQRIKNKINIYAFNQDNKLLENGKKNEDNLIQNLVGEGKEKDYIEDFMLLNDRTKKIDELISKLKIEEYLIFEDKMKLVENKEKSKKYCDAIFKALFGNTVFEVNSIYKMNYSGH